MEKESSSTGIIIGILVVVVILVVAWIAYAQGYFGGAKSNDNGGANVNVTLPAGNDQSGNASGGSGY